MFLDDFTVKAYKRNVIGEKCSAREFIQSCFWGGDPIDNEHEYDMILRELKKESK